MPGRAGCQAKQQAVRMILPSWFDHQAERFSVIFCPPVKTSHLLLIYSTSTIISTDTCRVEKEEGRMKKRRCSVFHIRSSSL